MKKIFVLVFTVFISGVVSAQGKGIQTAHVITHDFPETISGWGYTETMGRSKKNGLRIIVYSPPAKIHPGSRAEIILRGKSIPAVVGGISRLRGGMSVSISPVDEKSSLPQGKFAEGIITLGIHRDMPAVPDEAVLEDDGIKFAIVKEKGGFIKQRICAGISADGFTEVTSGLRPGEEVVTIGSYEIFHKNIGREYKVED